jgi:glutaredoxin 3
MVFAKTYCPYCREAKFTFQSLLKKLGLDDGKELTYKVIELDEQPDDDGSMIQNELYEITGQHTVPNIFIKGMHIGGNSDVQDLMRDEQLASMIQYN